MTVRQYWINGVVYTLVITANPNFTKGVEYLFCCNEIRKFGGTSIVCSFESTDEFDAYMSENFPTAERTF